MKLAILLTLTALAAAAQPFTITAQAGSASSAISPGGALTVAAPSIGSSTPIRLDFRYNGATTATVTGLSQTGTSDFSSSLPTLPQTLPSSSSLSASLTYKPTTGQPAQAQILLTYFETTATGTTTSPTTFAVNINGTAPDPVYTYAFQGGNAQAIADNGTIAFANTVVDTTRTANFTILNRGSAPATLSSILLSGEAFQLGGLQVPPYSIPANGSLSFTVSFAPTARGPQTGQLLVNFAGKDLKFNLAGTGISPSFTYTVVKPDSSTAPVAPGGTIPFPDTNTSASSSLTLIVANNGNGPGTINAISVVGPGFTAASTPFLPATLAVGAQFQFTLNFAPTAPGPATGGLKVGDDTFTLAGTGIGTQLTYSYTIGSATSPVAPGGTLQFAPSKIGDTGAMRFTVTNTGNATAAINTIFLTGSSAFTLLALPNLPLNLAPSASAGFNVRYAPTAVGVAQGTLQIGGASFALSGSAVAPDPLPTSSITGPSGNVSPLQQPSYSLSFRTPYTIDVIGTLNLSFTSGAFASDPSVQFATGGKTVEFFIPAGSTDAVFPNNSKQIAIQTGTVAGNITLYPTFATATGVDITPPTVPGVSLTVPQQAPAITSLSVSNSTAAGFTLNITGYATTRSVTQIQLQLTPASGINLTSSSLTIPADSAFGAWYQTTTSQSVGSAFTASVPITLSGSSTAKPIQSLSVVLINQQGTSTAQTVTIP